MATRPIVISVVSGKGGVGKTLLAANLATTTATHVARTLLIDLDFQNQGATGLIISNIKGTSEYTSVADIIANDSSEFKPISLTPQFDFLPATVDAKEFSTDTQACPNDRQIENLFSHIFSLTGYEVVVLDCHGGIDMVSATAYARSHHTLLVTEADAVTFRGTVRLLEYYKSLLSNNCDALPHTIHVIANRVDGKYSSHDLDRLYRPYFEGVISEFSKDKEIFLYLPSEPLMNDNFGGIPFFANIVSDSLYAKKMKLLAFEIFQDHFEMNVSGDAFADLASSRQRKKLRNQTQSSFEKARKTALDSVPAYAMLGLLFFGTAIISSFRNDGGMHLDKWSFTSLTLIMIMTTFTSLSCYISFLAAKCLRQAHTLHSRLWAAERTSGVNVIVSYVAWRTTQAVAFICVFMLFGIAVVTNKMVAEHSRHVSDVAPIELELAPQAPPFAAFPPTKGEE